MKTGKHTQFTVSLRRKIINNMPVTTTLYELEKNTQTL